MLRIRNVKKIITILVIFSLICAHINPAILGVISYAIDGEEKNSETEQQTKAMSIEISEFVKNDMLEQETEYQEIITLNPHFEEKFNEIIITDVSTNINDGNSEEKTANEEIDILYKLTKINKEDLSKVIGAKGKLEINYIQNDKDAESESQQNDKKIVTETNKGSEIEEKSTSKITLPIEENEKETSNGTIVLPEQETIELPEVQKGIINAEDSESVEININTEADEEGYITVVYPEDTIAVEIKIITDTKQIEELDIENYKTIAKAINIDEINELETVKNITINGEKELLNTIETINTPINYTKTVAELGMDKTQLSTSVENKVNLTVTLSTDKCVFDLYKNPQFIIELPSEVKTLNVNNMFILNNKYFEIETFEQGILSNNNKAILIKLKGEQLEHTKSVEENIQILLETTIITDELIPSLESKVNLYYQNENVKTYDGIGNQEIGLSSVPLKLIANSEIIVETKAILGDNVVSSFKENYANVVVEPNTYQTVQIIGTAINNTEKDIQNAKILGSATNIGIISGVENVYYTENENATEDLNNTENMWSSEYTPNAKRFLIIIDTFTQEQTVTFTYNMNLPEKIEEDVVHDVSFDVENMKTSKITIYQEAERFDIFQDEIISANIEINKTENIEVGDYVTYKVNITNISDSDLTNMTATIELPLTVNDILVQAYPSEEKTMVYARKNENSIEANIISIEKGKTVTIEISSKVADYSNPSEKIKAYINYEGKQAELSNKIKIIEPSELETSITSNKKGKVLEANEEIQYQIKLYNKGISHGVIAISLAKNENIDINKIEAVNLTTGEKTGLTAVSLQGIISNISINPEETVIINVVGVTKELKKNSQVNMYASITGENIYDITTSQLVNEINKKQEEIIEEIYENMEENEVQLNSINGTAWLDKNENGKIDKNEVVLKGIEAVLVDTNSAKIVEKTTTDNQGNYKFSNIDKGTYVVAFNYNTTTFAVTEYKSEDVEDELDSDVIQTTQNNNTTVKTEVLDLKNGKTESVNIGLVTNQKFDMSINKGITKVTVNNEQGTNEYNFESTNMAKVEIDGKYLKGSLLLVEYEIAVTNSGEVAGYAKTISDKIPEGMKFNSELNTNWYEDEEGIIYCEALAGKELNPGETAIVKLVLTKEMKDDKVTSTVNKAYLEKTFNEYLIEDKEQENNMSEATLIISLTTGKTENYIWLMILVISIIGIGAFGVIKLTNNDYNRITKKERR